MKSIALSLILTVVPASLWAQETGNAAGASPDTPGIETDRAAAAVAADHPNTVDPLFAPQAMLGGLAEVELGKLASERAQNDPVKGFARQETCLTGSTTAAQDFPWSKGSDT